MLKKLISKDSSDLWSGIVIGKYKPSSLKNKHDETLDFSRDIDKQKKNDQIERIQTTLFSSNSSRSQNFPLKSEKMIVHSSSEDNFDKNIVILRRNLSGFGRGKITEKKHENQFNTDNYDMIDKRKQNSASHKTLFY
jgi:hypothetical protein